MVKINNLTVLHLSLIQQRNKNSILAGLEILNRKLIQVLMFFHHFLMGIHLELIR